MGNSKKNITDLKAKALAGDVDAKHDLGMAYRRGDGVPVDKDKGAKLIIEAADGGCKLALSSVGVCYYFGDGVPKNHRLAMKWYQAAAAAGLVSGFFNVADLFDDSDEIPKNPVEALAWFTCSLGIMPDAAERMQPIAEPLSDENLDRAALRAVQIMKTAQAGKPLDMVGDFAAVSPIRGSKRPPGSTKASLLSYLLHFHHHSQTEFSDALLLREILEGKSPMYIAYDESVEEKVLRDLMGDKDRLARVAGVHRLEDGSTVLRVYDDFRHIEERVGKHFGREINAKELQELVTSSKINHVIINQGLPTAYGFSRRGASDGTKTEDPPKVEPVKPQVKTPAPAPIPMLRTDWDEIDEKDPKGYYAYFGVDPSSDLPAIRRAYERILKECADNPFVINEANTAYGVLSNPHKRRYYDTNQAALSRRMAETERLAAANRERSDNQGLFTDAIRRGVRINPVEPGERLNREWPQKQSSGCLVLFFPLLAGLALLFV